MSSILKDKIALLQTTFDLEALLKSSGSKAEIQDYYHVNRFAYSWLHSRTHMIHMAVSRDGYYKEDDLFAPARFVDHYIKKSKAQRVLELATGRGANACYLAKHNPKTRFYGIDLSPTQLKYAQQRSQTTPNYSPSLGNFHDLSVFEESGIDLVFVIESLCYSQNKEVVFKEVARVLSPGGYFILIDGYLNQPLKALGGHEQLACQLSAKGMAVNQFDTYADVLNKAKTQGFELVFQEDVSRFILPNLYRFEHLALRFLTLPQPIRKSIARVLPDLFLYNVVSGYLLCDLIEHSLACYWFTVLQKTGKKLGRI